MFTTFLLLQFIYLSRFFFDRLRQRYLLTAKFHSSLTAFFYSIILKMHQNTEMLFLKC